MFKKLKDKIAEEVKQSPLKSVQQLAQAVVSPTSSSVFEPSSSNDKFCIEEGDIEEEAASQVKQTKSGGFTSVTLTGQTNSPQSQRYGARPSLTPEADNLFPKFEAQPTNFHVQSDWESASEVEDRGGQLEHITKESIYEAYRKVYTKYNKMRNKYHELVTHYRQLERENHKAKTVLSDTQDKALLRISELREQCQLEQQAKAHLEEALRNELEERDHIIKALQTKVQYLKSSNGESTVEGECELPSENTDNLIDFEVPSPTSALLNTGSFDWYEEKLKECKELLNEKIAKVDDLRIDLENTAKLCSLKESSTKIDEYKFDVIKKDKVIYQSFVKLLCDLGKEIKVLQEKTFTPLPNEINDIANTDNSAESFASFKCSDITERILVKEGSDDGLFESANTLKEDQERQNDELKKHYDTIKDLRMKNEMLNKRLQEESSENKQAREKLEQLHQTFEAIKTQLDETNKQFRTGSLNLDAMRNFSLHDNDLIKEVAQCINNLVIISDEISNCKKCNMDLENELTTLKGRLKESEDLVVSSNTEKEQLKKENKTLEGKIIIAIGERDSLSEKITDLNNKHQEIQKEYESVQTSVSLNNDECSSHKDTIKKLQTELEHVSTNFKSQISQLEGTIEKKKIEKLSLVETTKLVSDELSFIKKQYEDVINERKNNIDLENKYKQLVNDQDIVVKAKDDLLIKVSKLKKLLSVSKEEFKNLKESMQTGKLECDQEQTVLENKVLDLETDIAKYEVEKSSMLEESKSLNNELSSLRKENESLIQEATVSIANFEIKLKELKNECTLSKELNTNLTNEISSLKEDHHNLISEKNKLHRQVTSLNTDLDKINDSLIVERAATEKLSEELSSLKEKYSMEVNDKKLLNDRINQLLNDYKVSSNSEEKLTCDMELLKEELSQVENKNKSLEHTNEMLKDLLNKQCESLSKHENNQKLVEELEIINKEKEDLEEANDTLKTRYIHLEENLQKCETVISLLREEKSSYEGEIKTLKCDIENLKQEVLHGQTKIVTNRETNQSLLQDIDRINQERNDFESKFSTVQTKLLGIEEDLLKSGKEVIALRQAKDRCSEEMVTLKSEFDMLSVQKETLQSKFDNLTNDFENLKNDHASLLEVNNKVSNDLGTCKKEYNDTIRMFNETKQLLEAEEKKGKALKEELKMLSESLGNSSLLLEEKMQELVCLKSDVKNLLKKLDKSNHELEIVQKERSALIKDVCGILQKTKDLKNYHQYLLDLVEAFKSEIFLKLSAVILIVENELVYKIDVLRDSDKSDDQVRESENKSKESNDDYNMKIKCLLDENINLEKKFSQAISIMESVRQFLFQISEEKSHSNNKIAKFREIGKDFIKHLSAMESFINNHGQRQNNNTKEKTYLKMENNNEPCVNVLPLNLKLDTMCEEELDSFFGASSTLPQAQASKQKEGMMFDQTLNNYDTANKNTEKLAIETHIQDNMIKNHQYEIDVPCALASKSCDDQAKYSQLEEENVKLQREVEVLKANIDLVTKQIADYKRQVEENEDESKLLVIENSGREQRHTISELKEQIENLQQDLEERGDAFEKLYEEHQQALKSRAEESHQLRQGYERDMHAQDKKWRGCLDRRLAETETRHQQLANQWEAHRKELETASRLAVSAVESGSNSGDLLRKQIQALTLQLKNKRCEVCCTKKVASEQSSRSIQDCTEMEYLRNIMYEYMMGKEPLVLSRVLCALMKFDDNQTKDIVQKEEHKITVLGQMGIL